MKLQSDKCVCVGGCVVSPVFPQLYFHMLRQRRRVLHGEVVVEKDD